MEGRQMGGEPKGFAEVIEDAPEWDEVARALTERDVFRFTCRESDFIL